MERPYRHIAVERTGDVHCVRLTQTKLDENGLYELSDDLNRLLAEGCRKLVLSLGPEEPQFLYSVFLAKLVSLQRKLQAAGGGMKLCQVGPDTMDIIAACGLVKLFSFYPDPPAAVAAFADN
jgi:anti-anti-sigma factor